MITPAEERALERALDLAPGPPGSDPVPAGPNPRVGCVILSADGEVLAEGWHRGAGTAHAEVDALSRLGGPASGGTAVVTLEPCAHRGRTGPCTEALLAAGIRRVVIARRDPNPLAAGGLERLRSAGIEVELVPAGPLHDRARELLRGWEHGLIHSRPLVTGKLALTLDGRIAAADGTSRWITGEAARAEVHELRERCDAVLVGTGTARADRPRLTARTADGTPARRQPLRAVMGRTAGVELLAPDPAAGPALALPTRDPAAALAELFARGVRQVLVEGGATLAAAFLAEGLVDELIVHLAPTFLGAGTPAVADLGITTLADRLDLDLVEARPLTSADGRTDLRLLLRPRAA